MKKIIVFLIACMLFLSAIAQISTRERPTSFNYELQPLSKSSANYKVLPELNFKQIYEEDILDEENGRPPRFGLKHKVNFNMQNSGEWTTLASGDKIWRLSILCPNALSIYLLYDKFWLPENTKLFIYEANKESYIGAFTSKNNTGTKSNPTGFATGITYGEEVIIEYYQPKEVMEQALISIDYVVHGYRYINVGTSKNLGDSDDCNININCPEGNNWQNEKNAIALILVDGVEEVRICTGSLINNTEQDNAPYFLTAEHCLCEGDYDAVSNPNLYYYMFLWHYEHPSCSNSSIEPLIISTVGATVIANYWQSDFALLELTEDPFADPNINPYYLGWDKSGNSGTSAVCIHHPQGDVKKISVGNNSPTNYTDYISWQAACLTNTPPNTHWKLNIDSGATESGSSGSPLINNNRRVIGQLHGKPGYVDDCAPTYAYYGKFSWSWSGNGNNENTKNLQSWLDPTNSNVQTLNGLGYCDIVTNYHSNCQISGSTSIPACTPPIT